MSPVSIITVVIAVATALKEVLKDDEVTTKIIDVMITNLYELEKAYPKNIKIKEENNE